MYLIRVYNENRRLIYEDCEKDWFSMTDRVKECRKLPNYDFLVVTDLCGDVPVIDESDIP